MTGQGDLTGQAIVDLSERWGAGISVFRLLSRKLMNPNSPSEAAGSFAKSRRLWHLPYLIGSFVGSVIIIAALAFWAGMRTGIFLGRLSGTVVVFHAVALVVGHFLTKPTWRRIVIVLSVSLFPAVSIALIQTHDAWCLHKELDERFRDNLANPIPGSVSDLSFILLKERYEPHLAFRFSIAPNELDAIIKAKGFKRIDVTQFRRPDDLFTHPEYLPLMEPASYYILNDVAAGYPDQGIGEGYTLKVSADRRHVIFRRESAAYYLNRYWAGVANITEEKRFLSLLGKSN